MAGRVGVGHNLRGRVRRHAALLVVLIAALVAATAAPAATRPRTMQLGATLVVTGQTGSAANEAVRAVGAVVVRTSWDGGPFRTIARTRTDKDGHYRVAFTPSRKGLVTLRIETPDNRPGVFLLRVV